MLGPAPGHELRPNEPRCLLEKITHQSKERPANFSSEIAVISVRGRGAKENICHIGELGGNKVVPATDYEADSRIICDTFLRFKGLERPAVIVTDLRLVSDSYETRMHIAVSRPTSLLRIVGVEKEMRKDLRLAELI